MVRRSGGLIVASFAVALLAIAVIAIAVSLTVRGQITQDSRRSAQKTATLLARVSFGEILQDEPEADRRRAEFSRAAAGAKQLLGLLQVTVLDSTPHVIYDTDERRIGTSPNITKPLRDALAGRASSDVVEGGDEDAESSSAKRIETYVPIGTGVRMQGVVHLDVPYAPVAAEISQRTRRINLILLGAGAALYLALLPGILRVARRLDREAERRRRRVVKQMRSALAGRDQIVLHYQPIVDIATGRVLAAEALVRWEHPTRGRVPPDDFLPVLEDTPVFWDLTLRVLDLAIGQAARWHAAGNEIAVAVNLSVGNVLDERLPGELEALFTKHGAPSRLLELEVTEQAIMERVTDAVDVLERLRGIGIGVIAIDDFGTGYSSLARVRDLPIQALKIDRSFVAEMEARDDPALVRSIIALAHSLELHVIAEGIETEEAWATLASFGCDAGQGYLIARPQPAGEFEAWFAEHDAAELAGRGEAILAAERRSGHGRRTVDAFATGLDRVPDAVVVLDDYGRHLYANAAAGELHGRDVEELIGRPFAAFARDGEHDAAEILWRRMRAVGTLRTRFFVGETEVDAHMRADVMPGQHIAILRPVARS